MILKFNQNVHYSIFEQESLTAEKPCIINGLIDDWGISKLRSIAETSDNEPERMTRIFEELASFLTSGMDTTVPVVFTADNKDPSEYGSSVCRNMSLKSYHDLWQDSISKQTKPDYYLKDWHFLNDVISPKKFYKVPKLFQGDLLNKHCRATDQSDYKFIYFGPKGSYTPVHHDVIFSHSWSSNIFGSKKWTFYVPDNARDADLFELSGDAQAIKNLCATEVIQRAGDTIVVPSGLYHEVENLEPVLSVNHNWITPHCFPRVEKYMSWEKARTKVSLQDLLEIVSVEVFSQKCEEVLKLNVGFNMSDINRIRLYM